VNNLNVIEFMGKKPKIHRTAFVDPMARISGDVEIGMYSSVWFGTAIRGDEEKVVIGRMVAILENCFIEAPAGHPTKIEDEVLVAHGAILHGCHVGEGSCIGIGAIVLDGAKIGAEAIVGAGAVVPPNTIIEDSVLALGIPAKPVRKVREEEKKRIRAEVMRVMEKAKEYRRKIESLP